MLSLKSFGLHFRNSSLKNANSAIIKDNANKPAEKGKTFFFYINVLLAGTFCHTMAVVSGLFSILLGHQGENVECSSKFTPVPLHPLVYSN